MSIVGGIAACGSFGTQPAPNNASSDAGVADVVDSGSPDAAERPCPPGALFCDFFERATGADVKGSWTSVRQENGATLAIDPAKSGALGASLHLTLLDQKDGRATLDRPIKTQTKVAVTFSLRIDQFPSTRNVHFVALATTTGSVPYVFLRIKPTGLVLVEQDQTQGIEKEYVCPLNASQWTRFELTLRPTGSDATAPEAHAELAREGQNCVNADLSIVTPGVDRLSFGVTYASTGGGPYELWLDDVVVDLR
jgi:hypothetical protein